MNGTAKREGAHRKYEGKPCAKVKGRDRFKEGVAIRWNAV